MKHNLSKQTPTSSLPSYDVWKTTPPHECEEDGHDWHVYGYDSDGYAYVKCRHCRKEDD